MDLKLLKLIDHGKTILDIEKVITATKFMKQSNEVRKIMLDLKERIVNELIEDYKHIDKKETPKPDEPMYSAENSSYEVEDGHIKEPDENKTLEELSEEEEEEIKEEELPEKFTIPKPKPKPKSKRTAYSKTKRKT